MAVLLIVSVVVAAVCVLAGFDALTGRVTSWRRNRLIDQRLAEKQEWPR